MRGCESGWVRGCESACVRVFFLKSSRIGGGGGGGGGHRQEATQWETLLVRKRWAWLVMVEGM